MPRIHKYVLSDKNHFKTLIIIVTSTVRVVIVISRFLKRYLRAKRTMAPAYSRALRRIKGFFPKGVKRSSGQISRIPGEDRVAVEMGVVQMKRVNDQMG